MKNLNKKIAALMILMMSLSAVAHAEDTEESVLDFSKEIAKQEHVTVTMVAAVDRKLASVTPTDDSNPVKVALIKRVHKAQKRK